METRSFKDKYGCEIEDLVKPLMSRARRLGLTSYWHDAEDLTFRTLAHMDDNEPSEAVRSPKAYACTILVHLHLRDRRRTEHKMTRTADLTAPEWDRPDVDVPTVEEQAMAASIRRAIETAVNVLTAAQREVVVLRLGLDNDELTGMPFDEIGAVLGIETATARKRYQKAVEGLKRLLADLHDDPTTDSNEERPA